MQQQDDLRIEWAGGANLEDATRLFVQYLAFYGRADRDEDGCRAFLRARLRRAEAAAFVARTATGACGFVLLYPTFSSLSRCRGFILNDLFVASSERRRGLGERLVRFALLYAKQEGAAFVELATQNSNETAQRIYHRLGFERDSEFTHLHIKVSG